MPAGNLCIAEPAARAAGTLRRAEREKLLKNGA